MCQRPRGYGFSGSAEYGKYSSSVSRNEEGTLFADERRAVFTAVLPGRDYVRAGNRLTFDIDPDALHFFDPESGIALR
jgi:hypothetical protein